MDIKINEKKVGKKHARARTCVSEMYITFKTNKMHVKGIFICSEEEISTQHECGE